MAALAPVSPSSQHLEACGCTQSLVPPNRAQGCKNTISVPLCGFQCHIFSSLKACSESSFVVNSLPSFIFMSYTSSSAEKNMLPHFVAPDTQIRPVHPRSHVDEGVLAKFSGAMADRPSSSISNSTSSRQSTKSPFDSAFDGDTSTHETTTSINRVFMHRSANHLTDGFSKHFPSRLLFPLGCQRTKYRLRNVKKVR